MSKTIKMKARKKPFMINAEIRIKLRRRKVADLLNRRYTPEEIVDKLATFSPKVDGKKKIGYLKASYHTIIEDIKVIQEERKVWYDRNPEKLQREIDRAISAADKIIKESRKRKRLGLVLKAEMWRAKLLGISVERFEGHIKGLPTTPTPNQKEMLDRLKKLQDRLKKLQEMGEKTK